MVTSAGPAYLTVSPKFFLLLRSCLTQLKVPIEIKKYFTTKIVCRRVGLLRNSSQETIDSVVTRTAQPFSDDHLGAASREHDNVPGGTIEISQNFAKHFQSVTVEIVALVWSFTSIERATQKQKTISNYKQQRQGERYSSPEEEGRI